LAILNETAKSVPNRFILINALTLQEAKDKALGLVLPLANTDGMIEHLRLISKATEKDRVTP
jgi:hypothetical protein